VLTGVPFLARPEAADAVLQVLDTVLRRPQVKETPSWAVAYRVDEEALAARGTLTVLPEPAAALALVRHCTTADGLGRCPEARTSLLFFDPLSGALQHGHIGLHRGYQPLTLDRKRLVFTIDDVPVAAFGNEGNIYLKGTLSSYQDLTPTAAQEILFLDPNGTVVARIDADGNLLARGTVHQSADDVNDTTRPGLDEQVYLDQAPPADIVAGRPGTQCYRLQVDGHTALRLDEHGNVLLRGIVLEDHNGF